MSDPALPPLYERWVQPLLGDIPAEGKATCSDCAMCDTPTRKVAEAYAFRPDVKCCAHLPNLPNFLVGGILADKTMDHGRTSVLQRIEGRVGVSPWGVRATPAYKLLQKHSANAIGRSVELRCPHFQVEDQTCGIHAHRNHLCATWFCKHERGATGFTFWRALFHFLESIEKDLAYWCALKLDLSPSALQLMDVKERKVELVDSNEMDGILSDAVYNGFWGNWLGREQDFYKESAGLVGALDGKEVMDICGPQTRALLEVARSAHEKLLDQRLPETLRCGSYQLLSVGAEGIAGMTYNSTDPIGIPAPILSVLHLFDGRPTEEIFQQLEEERGMQLSEELLRSLVDWGVLKGADAAPGDSPD